MKTVAAVLGGGTYFRVGVRRFSHDTSETIFSAELATRDAQRTLAEVEELLRPFALDAAGMSMFGPIALEGEMRGTIGTTPKPGWEGAQVLDVFGLPRKNVSLETDVGGAALAELHARPDVKSLVYITVGTGVGGALAIRSEDTLDAASRVRVFRGQSHSEMGHLLVPQGEHAGVCPYHGACVEGLASGPAIEAIAKRPAHELSDENVAFEVAANALVHLVESLVLIASPEVVVLGGGVVEKRPFLRARVSERLRLKAFKRALPAVEAPVHERPGLEGAFLLGRRVLEGS